MPSRERASRSREGRRGGRPPRLLAEQIPEQILEVATPLFLSEGYGATSIEAVAKRAHMSKRTVYSRFRDKAELFGAVVHRLVEQLRPPNTAPEQFFEGASLEAILHRLAPLILRAALSPSALALHRVIVAEAARFPELATAVNQEGTRRDAIRRIAALLEAETKAGRLGVEHAEFAAEQFLHMLVAGPQRRALGLGAPMSSAELDAWARDAVGLFLNGCRATIAR
jgi:TetR/AcrR family transcriptional regulator, mexJK operon transcriptional repressor